MTDKERQAITEAARQHAMQSARAQGLPDTITDPDALRKVAALIATHTKQQAA